MVHSLHFVAGIGEFDDGQFVFLLLIALGGRMDEFVEPVFQREKFRRKELLGERGRGTGFSMNSRTPPGFAPMTRMRSER